MTPVWTYEIFIYGKRYLIMILFRRSFKVAFWTTQYTLVTIEIKSLFLDGSFSNISVTLAQTKFIPSVIFWRITIHNSIDLRGAWSSFSNLYFFTLLLFSSWFIWTCSSSLSNMILFRFFTNQLVSEQRILLHFLENNVSC